MMSMIAEFSQDDWGKFSRFQKVYFGFYNFLGTLGAEKHVFKPVVFRVATHLSAPR